MAASTRARRDCCFARPYRDSRSRFASFRFLSRGFATVRSVSPLPSARSRLSCRPRCPRPVSVTIEVATGRSPLSGTLSPHLSVVIRLCPHLGHRVPWPRLVASQTVLFTLVPLLTAIFHFGRPYASSVTRTASSSSGFRRPIHLASPVSLLNKTDIHEILRVVEC